VRGWFEPVDAVDDRLLLKKSLLGQHSDSSQAANSRATHNRITMGYVHGSKLNRRSWQDFFPPRFDDCQQQALTINDT
jgi:hypothetical protein